MPVLDKVMTLIYNSMPISIGKCLATYIWIDDIGDNVQGKTWTLNSIPDTVKDIPIWNFDGSSDYQSLGASSDTLLNPVALFKDPFLKGDHKLVMCETYKNDQTPTNSNNRASCNQAMEAVKHLRPWFGLEQEYCLLDMDLQPYGLPKGGYTSPKEPFNCGVEGGKAYGRDVMETHYRACLNAGINITGTNFEVLLSQWEYHIGPCEGIDIADQVWVSRYILNRVAENYGVVVTLDPKYNPLVGNWNGSGAHMDFSTQAMREEGGITEIEKAIKKLRNGYKKQVYDSKEGKHKERCLVGRLETSYINTFASGDGHRGVSVRIQGMFAAEKKGYLEDRRPSSSCDPYCIAEAIIRTCCLNE